MSRRGGRPCKVRETMEGFIPCGLLVLVAIGSKNGHENCIILLAGCFQDRCCLLDIVFPPILSLLLFPTMWQL